MKVLSLGHLLEFLHDHLTEQPGVDVFKVWALCKESQEYVTKQYGTCPQIFRHSFMKQKVIKMFTAKPSFTKFHGNKYQLNMIKKLAKSFVFGGPVTESVRIVYEPQDVAGSEPIIKELKNSVNDLIKKVDIGRHGRYVVLRNVQISMGNFLDIYMLVSADSELPSKLESWQQLSLKEQIINQKANAGSSTKKPDGALSFRQKISEAKQRYQSPYRQSRKQEEEPLILDQFLQFSEVKQYLTGFGRIVEFKLAGSANSAVQSETYSQTNMSFSVCEDQSDFVFNLK